MRLYLLFPALIAILGAGAPVHAESPDPAITRGPYLQLATPSGIRIVWRTRTTGQPGLRFGLQPGTLDQTLPEKQILQKRNPDDLPEDSVEPTLHSAPDRTRQFEAELTGLLPDTLYYYSIVEGTETLTVPGSAFSFRTLPVPGTPRNALFWVVGDSGTGNRVQLQVHTAMRNWLGRHRRVLDGYIHVGDMAYGSGLDSEFQGYFFESYAETLRNTVCWPSMGNHEGRYSSGKTGIGPYFDAYICPQEAQAGGVASGTESYYSFDFGRIHWICLNSHDLPRDPGGAMAQWLKADLDRTKADWLIAYWHHPPYTKGSHDSDKELQLVEMRSMIMPILESGGVDLVLTGHSHIYERSMLMDGAYATPTVATNVILNDGDGKPDGNGAYLKSAGLHPNRGTVQIVTGHGGTTLSRKTDPSPVMRASILEFGSVLLDFRGDVLQALMLNKDGEIRDSFEMRKRGDIAVNRIEKPWQPPAFTGPRTIPLQYASLDKSGQPVQPVALSTNAQALIPQGADWLYLAGKVPDYGWQEPSFDGTGWLTGKAGFGYGDKDDATLLPAMRGKYRQVSIRHSFDMTGTENPDLLRLQISYDDGFIAYLNGREVLRINVESGSQDKVQGVISHEAERRFITYPLNVPRGVLKPGSNALTLEGYNDDLDSSDFTLHPALFLEPK